MLNTSAEFRSARKEENYLAKAVISFRSGEIYTASLDDIMLNGFTISDSVSSDGNFDLGGAVIGKMTLTLNNYNNKFSLYDFSGAIIKPYVGLQVGDHMEWLAKGIYCVDTATTVGSVVQIEALDNMELLDRPYTDSSLIYPATVGQIVQDVCYTCGVQLRSSAFFNAGYSVPVRPGDEAMTCREIVSYAAMIGGCYARCANDGVLEIKWYDMDAFGDGLDGGDFVDYASGDTADGGTFKDYSSGTAADGGTFEEMRKYHHLYDLYSLNSSTDDITITGIRINIAQDDEEQSTASYFYGQEGYVLLIEDNPLIQDNPQGLVNSIGSKLVGMTFRPLTCQIIGDPAIEAGDPAYVSDRKGNSYACYVTNLSYAIGGYETITCDAQTESEQKSIRYNAMTKVERKIAHEIAPKLSNLEQEMSRFNNLMTNAMGYYQTKVTQEDGSTVMYLHDKPDLKDSVTVWKQSIDGFAVSLDGGKTWSYGITKDGNIVANVLSVIGINADWINAGVIRALQLIGCSIDGGSITSGTDAGAKTTIINGQIFSNSLFLSTVANPSQAQSYMTPGILALWDATGVNNFVVDLQGNSDRITTTLPMEVKNNIYAVGKDIMVGTINGQQIVTPYTLNNYVTRDQHQSDINSIWQTIGTILQLINNK